MSSDNRVRFVSSLCAAALGIALGVNVADTASAQGSLVAPQAIDQPQPPVPTNAAGMPVHGWAVVRYSVLGDGSTSNVRVLDIVPPVVNAAPVIEAVNQWTFRPATENDEPIDWHNAESLVVLAPEVAPASLSEAFRDRYDSIRQLLEAGSYDEALLATDSLLDDCQTLIELGLVLGQRAIIFYGQDDLQSALGQLQLATDSRIPALPQEDLVVALRLRFQVEGLLGRRRDALDTYERLARFVDPESLVAFEELAERLREEWETIDALPVLARTDEEPWRITPSRRTFTFADVVGRIRSIDIECDRRAANLAFQADVEWSLPEAWGNCELFVDADPGTTFTYYEFLDLQEQEG